MEFIITKDEINWNEDRINLDEQIMGYFEEKDMEIPSRFTVKVWNKDIIITMGEFSHLHSYEFGRDFFILIHRGVWKVFKSEFKFFGKVDEFGNIRCVFLSETDCVDFFIDHRAFVLGEEEYMITKGNGIEYNNDEWEIEFLHKYDEKWENLFHMLQNIEGSLFCIDTEV